MSGVKLIWATPDADALIAYMARVSNPVNQDNPSIEGLLKYMLREGHVSPFEMVNVCLEIETTRDIGRQILRHRSFSFQEFSQRYANVEDLGDWQRREPRMQDTKNRQNSLPCTDTDTYDFWTDLESMVATTAIDAYRSALSCGIAKEQARALLPEGLTPSRMYMNGTLRSWITYLKQRLHASTQAEHRVLATQVLEILRGAAPVTIGAFFPEDDASA